MKAFINCELILHDHLFPDAVLIVDNGKIVSFEKMNKAKIPEGCEIIDVKGDYIGPGFIDIHTHCGKCISFMIDPITAAKDHLYHGVTTVLPTIAYRYEPHEYTEFFKKIKEIMKTDGGKNIGGIYSEGPYINPNFGANKPLIKLKGAAKREDYEAFVKEGKDIVLAYTVAPEREGIEEFCKFAHEQNPNVIFTCGHSEALPWQIEKLMKYGLKIGTHHTNATGTIINYPECRGVCVDECINYNKELYAEIICDSCGIHVHPYMQRLIRQIKGDDKIILISDQAGDGEEPAEPPAGYEGVTDIGFDKYGEISGSKITLDKAARNMMVHTGASMVDVFNYASYNPAKVMNFYDLGEISVGKTANLVICDHRINIKDVYFKGEKVIRPKDLN